MEVLQRGDDIAPEAGRYRVAFVQGKPGNGQIRVRRQPLTDQGGLAVTGGGADQTQACPGGEQAIQALLEQWARHQAGSSRRGSQLGEQQGVGQHPVTRYSDESYHG